MRLLPRQEKFFTLLLEQARIISTASELLLNGVKAGNSSLSAASEQIRHLEHKGDQILRDVFTKLNQTFITPLDPEDIHHLSSNLDDVLDGIEDAAHRIVAYEMNPIGTSVADLCAILDRCSHALVAAFDALNKGTKVLDHCNTIAGLEDEADVVERRAIADLFRTETNPIELIKHKEIYEVLESTVDSCKHVALRLENVVVKNS
ncbi:MAG: DUF47 family protein [Bryobacteraceae bacterium]